MNNYSKITKSLYGSFHESGTDGDIGKLITGHLENTTVSATAR